MAKPTGNQAVTDLEEVFKKRGFVKTSKDFADLIGENPNGLSDIKAGRKKLTIDHIRNLKKSHPEVNVEWVLNGVGEMFLPQKKEPVEVDTAMSSDRKLLLDELLAEVRLLRGLTDKQAETILNLSRAMAIPNQR